MDIVRQKPALIENGLLYPPTRGDARFDCERDTCGCRLASTLEPGHILLGDHKGGATADGQVDNSVTPIQQYDALEDLLQTYQGACSPAVSFALSTAP